jgi:hypothetical protein
MQINPDFPIGLIDLHDPWQSSVHKCAEGIFALIDHSLCSCVAFSSTREELRDFNEQCIRGEASLHDLLIDFIIDHNDETRRMNEEHDRLVALQMDNMNPEFISERV